MAETAVGRREKETVILVHGTFAAPSEDALQWYQPGSAFVAHLDKALESAGSPARCWAHLEEGESIFSWSGLNNWQHRSSAAAALASTLEKLRSDGWRCHVIAHSHGGNVLLQALKSTARTEFLDVQAWNSGNLVTIGTPFLEAPEIGLLKRRLSPPTAQILISALALSGLLYLGSIVSPNGQGDLVTLALWIMASSVWVGAAFVGIPLAAREAFRSLLVPGFSPTANRRLLIINSRYDEAWQVLNHAMSIRAAGNKRRGLRNRIRSLGRAVWTAHQQVIQLEALKYPYRIRWIDAGVWLFPVLAVLYLWLANPREIELFQALDSPLGWLIWFYSVFIGALAVGSRRAFRAALSAPGRLVWRYAMVIDALFRNMIFRVVSNRVGAVFKASAFGLDNFPFEWPTLSRVPKTVSNGFYRYLEVPHEVSLAVLKTRGDDLMRHVESLTQVDPAKDALDASALMRGVANDTRLVHGCYYSDPGLMTTIAEWIGRSEVEVLWSNWNVPEEKRDALRARGWAGTRPKKAAA